MKLPVSREEIVERFRLCGEITCTLFELYDDEDDYENGAIAWDDIQDVLDIEDELLIELQGEEKHCAFVGLSMDDEKMFVDFIDEVGCHCSVVYTQVSSKSLKTVNEVVTRYVYELKKMEG